MNVLIRVVAIWLLVDVAGIVIFLLDTYKYPICPLCGKNVVEVEVSGELVLTKRIKGKIFCPIHGEINWPAPDL